MAAIDSLEKALKYHFGYDQFRPNQRHIIEAALNNLPQMTNMRSLAECQVHHESNPYTQQLANNPDLEIYEGGWRYLPILGLSTIKYPAGL